MSAPTATQLLPKVRRAVLQLRASSSSDRCGFGLSWLTWQLGPVRYSADLGDRSRFTSGGLKSIRGRAQACLAMLAREGIVYGRNRPEPAVQSYEHCETDKRFRVRITQQEAQRRLARMK